jgi:hypothetical protein
MGYRLRWFIAEDNGTVTRVPATTCARWFDGEALRAARAGRDLKLLEVVVNVDRRHVVGVLRILPFRQGVREDGRLDLSGAARLAMKRVDLLGPVDPADVAAQIERLEADANYFWWPTDGQLRALGTALLKRPSTSLQLVDLRTAVVVPGQALPDR